MGELEDVCFLRLLPLGPRRCGSSCASRSAHQGGFGLSINRFAVVLPETSIELGSALQGCRTVSDVAVAGDRNAMPWGQAAALIVRRVGEPCKEFLHAVLVEVRVQVTFKSRQSAAIRQSAPNGVPGKASDITQIVLKLS